MPKIGTFPAGSMIVPLTVVRAPPAQAGTVQAPSAQVDCLQARFVQGLGGAGAPAVPVPPLPLPPPYPAPGGEVPWGSPGLNVHPSTTTTTALTPTTSAPAERKVSASRM